MHVAAAGELLLRGQAERVGHLLVAARARYLGLHQDRLGRQRRYLDAGPGRSVSGGCPAPPHFTAEVIERTARLGIGLQLLQLQFDFQHLCPHRAPSFSAGTMSLSGVRPPDRLQYGPGHGLGSSRRHVDQQELFLDLRLRGLIVRGQRLRGLDAEADSSAASP